MAEIDAIDVQLIGCVEDAIDKLKINGQIMPLTYEMKLNAKDILNETLNELKENQNDIEAKFGEALSQNAAADRMEQVTKNLKAAAHAINRSLRQSPFGAEVFQKIEIERLFLENLLQHVIGEININGFPSVRQAVQKEKTDKLEYHDIIKREEESRRLIKELQKSIIDIRQEKEIETQKRNELIAHLKDRLQELKAKTNMEAKYVKKSTDNSVEQVKKRCDLAELELKKQIEKLQEQIDEENRCNAELESFLKSAINNTKKLTEHWSEKSDRNTLDLQVALDQLKTKRQKDLEKYNNLAKTFSEYEKVVVEDHMEKDREKRRLEQEKYELEASVKIQAWWRAQMLRHKLGGKGKKKKKGKKGKKGKKKKK